ncbi:outer membrane protein assembly factor BamB family protein [Dyadobacter tibetensis]|uniref:outer membrane protein assembly factor BamB family protein n=1 Tax=Dyadobacter tibetensis TaxID=1211851 RepID=UPI0018DB869D|nr:PQQ-binding-like beta-propeller repeat protein [Dyadobacter tibetensis]
MVTQLPYQWRSSLTDGAFGQKLYNGYTIRNTGVLCELKREANSDNSSWKSSLALKDAITGKNLWIWDDFYDNKLIRTLNDDIVVIDNKIWVHDLMADYCIDATKGSTIWKYQRVFPAYSEACNIEEDFYFIANGLIAHKEGKIADSFFKYISNGSDYTELGHPPYDEKYAYHNGLGYYLGSLKDIYAFRRDNINYMVVSYVEMGPRIGPTQQPSNSSFLGLFNLSDNVWEYDRIPVSFEGEFGTLSLKPIVNEDNIFLTSGNFVLCFDLFTGKKKWHRRLTSAWTGPVDMILADHKLLVNMADATLYCLNSIDGSKRWTQKSSSLASDLYHQNGIIYWIPLGNLRAVDLETGKLLWNLDTIEREAVKSHKSEWHGFVTGIPGKNGEKGKIFATSDHYLYCFEAIR